jgi:hypothetical protein
MSTLPAAFLALRSMEARTTNGTGNNATNEDWGAIDQTFTRVAENSYEDGEALMARARPLEWAPAGTVIDPFLGRPVFINNPADEVPQGRAGPNRPDGTIPLTDDVRFVNQPTGTLPQARDISNAVFVQPKDAAGNDLSLPNSVGFNDLGLFFGQALTHDMVETQVNVTAVSFVAADGVGWSGGRLDANGEPTAAVLVRVNTVTGQPILDANGQPIPVDLEQLAVENPAVYQKYVDHQVLSKGSPFALQRTPGVVDEEGVRQQANTETSFLDLGNVYGKVVTVTLDAASIDLAHPAVVDSTLNSDGTVRVTLDTSVLLRRSGPDGPSGFLLTSNDVLDGLRDAENLLPTYGEVNAHQGLLTNLDSTAANDIQVGMGRIFDPTLEAFFSLDRFAAGDQRVNQNAATITQQTIWLRNHNEWAQQLTDAFPDWSGDEIFSAARTLNEASYQRAIYKEYLPGLIGEAGAALMGAYTGYKPDVNPAIINEWTTIAFRFGHDQSSNFVDKQREDGSVSQTVRLIDSFNAASAATAVRNGAELDEWLRGQLSATTQAIDGFVVEGNRNQLFGVTVSPVTGLPVQTDLTVFDIVRGRDHGVNSYAKLREAMGLTVYTSFEEWAADNNVSDFRRDALKELYGNDFSQLDAYVGGLLEAPWQDSQLGETFTMIVALQFQMVRDGDRFYYENRLEDEPALLAMVEDITMADIIRRTTDIEHVYRDAFMAHERIGGDGGSDTLWGTDGRDLIIGFAGNDTLHGGDHRDDLYGGEGRDILYGGAGADLLEGGAGNDHLLGGDPASRGNPRDGAASTPGDGNDDLRGGDGNDYLRGADGDDVLDGGNGRDMMIGDDGNDTFVFALNGDRERDRDMIRDFDAMGDDRLVIDVADPLAAASASTLSARAAGMWWSLWRTATPSSSRTPRGPGASTSRTPAARSSSSDPRQQKMGRALLPAPVWEENGPAGEGPPAMSKGGAPQ